MRARVSGMGAVNRALNELIRNVEHLGLVEALERCGAVLRDEMTAAYPVKTGRAKATIKARIRKGKRPMSYTLYVGPTLAYDEKYPGYLESGTRKMKARKIARKAARRSRSAAEAAIRQTVPNAVARSAQH